MIISSPCTDAIEELDDVSGGFGEGDVGDHRVDLLYDRSIINCGGRAIATESIGRTHGDARFSSKVFQICQYSISIE